MREVGAEEIAKEKRDNRVMGSMTPGSIKEMEFGCVKMCSFQQGSQRLDLVHLDTYRALS